MTQVQNNGWPEGRQLRNTPKTRKRQTGQIVFLEFEICLEFGAWCLGFKDLPSGSESVSGSKKKISVIEIRMT